jgi:hypothetical protein
MKLRIAHGTFLLSLLGAAAFGADIYRFTAPDGTVSYSDRPPQGADSVFVLSAAPRAPAPAVPPAPTGEATAAPPEAAAEPAPLPAGPTAAELRLQRQRNCEIAHERMERYTVSRRLFRTDAAGEREYLDDGAVAEARAKAAADVEDWCG